MLGADAEIVSPVSICMAMTVLLVRLLNPEGNSDTAAIFIASTYYSEKVGVGKSPPFKPSVSWHNWAWMGFSGKSVQHAGR
jgi:hypothetical protein